MASSPDAQQPDTLAPSSSEPPQEPRPRRVVLLDLTSTETSYICGNRLYLIRNYPMSNDRDQSIVPSRSGLDLDLSHDIFYLSGQFVKLRFRVMDDTLHEHSHRHQDPWHSNAATRPSHVMLDARNMLEVLQEASTGDSAFHGLRKHQEYRPRGLLDFFQLFGIVNPAASNTLEKVTVFVPTRSDDLLGHFDYHSLEHMPFPPCDGMDERRVMLLAKTDTQKEQLRRIMDIWQQLEGQARNLRFPALEFARHPQY